MIRSVYTDADECSRVTVECLGTDRWRIGIELRDDPEHTWEQRSGAWACLNKDNAHRVMYALQVSLQIDEHLLASTAGSDV